LANIQIHRVEATFWGRAGFYSASPQLLSPEWVLLWCLQTCSLRPAGKQLKLTRPLSSSQPSAMTEEAKLLYDLCL